MDLTETFNQMAEEIHVRETERFDHLARIGFSRGVGRILSETTEEGLLQKIVDASRAVTNAKSSRGGTQGGRCRRHRAVSQAEGVQACPPLETFRVHKGGSISK